MTILQKCFQNASELLFSSDFNGLILPPENISQAEA
jgi:hypothetical protein